MKVDTLSLQKIGHWIIRDQSKIMRNIDDPCIRNGGDVNRKKERIAIYDYSTTPGEPEMVISSKSQYMPSDWFSYCTLKPSILLKIVLEITWSKSCFSWSGFDTNSILKNGLTIAVLEIEETSITKEEGRLSTGEPVISISRYAKEVIYSSFRKAEGQRRHRPWLWNCNTSGVMSTT